MMSVQVPLTGGAKRFFDDLTAELHEPVRQGGVIRYSVVPASGPLSGSRVETGVSVGELEGWPAAPPHWIHLPESVQFAHTNCDAQDCPPGWRRHSRDTGQWLLDRPAVHLWIAHVRGMLAMAL